MLQKLFEIHEQTIARYTNDTKRFLYNQINWDVNAICVYGSRGTGKTTLIIQNYLENYGDINKALYISADNIHVIAHGLYEIADEYFKYGGKALFIDEIHKYPNWSTELKNIIDVYGERKIVFSGSSSLNLIKGLGDLSRRVIYYHLPGLSFREYLGFETGQLYNTFNLKQILQNHVNIASEIKKRVSILSEFRNYLRYGYYPFYLEGKEEYTNRLQNVIEKVLFEDLTVVFNIRQSKLPVIKKMLWLIAASPPFSPNIDRLSRELGISREYVYHYLECLEKSGLLISVKKYGKGLRTIRKPAKIYLENPNLISVISDETNSSRLSGSLRETFFINQLRQIFFVSNPNKGDFMIDNKYTFEVGGKNKDFSQIKNIAQSYLATDGIEIGFSEKIPLYLFGFLY